MNLLFPGRQQTATVSNVRQYRAHWPNVCSLFAFRALFSFPWPEVRIGEMFHLINGVLT